MNTYFQKIRWQIFILTILMITFSPLQTMALEIATHRAINEINAAKGSFLHQYLINQLGMKDGVETEINKKWIIKYISDGGEEEDAGIRALNHFLNPITNQGLSGQYSALAWAMLPIGAQPLAPISSWNDVRDYYTKALTSRDKTTRDNYFALTFHGVGQIMHLVEDMSVPAHVRLDVHPPPFWNDDYENWAKTNIKDATQVGTYSVSTFTPNDSSFLIPRLFDTDQYNGSNPTSATDIGLAEYTNANFLSQGTIFSANFTYPAYSDMLPKIETDSSYGKQILYLSKSGHGESVDYFARAGNFYNYLPADYKKLSLTLDDDKVHANYAHFLIPRASGYSSQVLSYFFRGRLNVEVNQGSLKVKNASNEAMTGGQFELYYDNSNEERTYLTTSLVTELSPGTEQIIPFNAPQDATSYILVYRGQLGSEPNAVVGKFITNVELVVITVGLVSNPYVNGESLTKSVSFVWNPVNNSLECSPINHDDENFQAWYKARSIIGHDFYSSPVECGVLNIPVGSQMSGCSLLTPGTEDTATNESSSVIIGNWCGTTLYQRTRSFSHDIKAWTHNPDLGFWGQYPQSFFQLVNLPGSPVSVAGLRTHSVMSGKSLSTDVTTGGYYDITGYLNAAAISTFYSPFGALGSFEGYAHVTGGDFYYGMWPMWWETYFIPAWESASKISVIDSAYPWSTPAYIKPVNTWTEYDYYVFNHKWSDFSVLKGRYSEKTIVDVCFVQFTPCKINVYKSNEFGTPPATASYTFDNSRNVYIHAQAINVPQGTTGYDWVAAGRNAALEAQIIAAINMAYSLNGIPANEIRSTSIDISIVK